MRLGDRRFNIFWCVSLLYIDCDQSLKILRNSGFLNVLQAAGLAEQDPSDVLAAAENLSLHLFIVTLAPLNVSTSCFFGICFLLERGKRSARCLALGSYFCLGRLRR
jgi:hypothetical protein